MFGPRVVGEGMGRGNGESITANAMSNRPTNVTKTNQCPAFVAYRRKEVYIHPHAEQTVRKNPSTQIYANTTSMANMRK